MNKQEQIRQYLEQTFEALEKINPELANAEKRQRANEMFLNAEADFEIVKQKIDKAREELLESYQEQLRMREFYKKMREQGYYQNFEKDNRESRTFAQVQEAYNKLQAVLGENASKVYISGGIAPYLLLNRDSGRLHDDIDSGCLVSDIAMLRELFKNTPYYNAEWDSLTYAHDGIDYGFELNIDGVPVTIAPFDYKDGKLISYGFDPYTKELKYRESPAPNFSDYFTAYKGADGRIYYMTTLEYIKKCKDSVQRPKDIEDSKIIEQIGIRQDIYDRIVAPEIQQVNNRYLDDFAKIQELLSKTMDTYCTEFLEKKGIENPLSEDNMEKLKHQLLSCSSDEKYAEIVSNYLQSFQEGHLFLKSNEEQRPDEVTPLYVKQVDGKYVISATKDENLEHQEILSINGIPIEQYLIEKGYQHDIEMKIIGQDGQPIIPEFHINEDICFVTTANDTPVLVDNIPIAEAIELKQEKGIENSPNVICGYTVEGIPYVRIKSFGRTEGQKAEDKKQIDEFATQIQGQKDLVIDIRGNKGGSDEYIEYLGAFSNGTYTDRHEYEELVGISEKETNANNKGKQIEDIDTTLERIDNNPNRKRAWHDSTIPDGESTIENRLLLVDGQVFSSADKMAKTVQDSGFATVVGTELTAGDGKGVSVHQVDTPLLREQGLSITMPSSMGLDYSEFQTTPDIMTSEHEINTNLGQIMEQAKEQKKTEVVEWIEVKSPQQELQQSAIEQSHDTENTFANASSLHANQTQSLGNVGQNAISGMSNGMSNSAPSNSGPSMSSGGRSR